MVTGFLRAKDPKMGDKKAVPSTTRNHEEDLYWVRAGSDSLGIMVATAWMLSKPRSFQKHAHLYDSCSWDTLVSHPFVLNMFVLFPSLPYVSVFCPLIA